MPRMAVSTAAPASGLQRAATAAGPRVPTAVVCTGCVKPPWCPPPPRALAPLFAHTPTLLPERLLLLRPCAQHFLPAHPLAPTPPHPTSPISLLFRSSSSLSFPPSRGLLVIPLLLWWLRWRGCPLLHV